MNGREQDRRPWAKRLGRSGALAVSLGAHATLFVALVGAWPAAKATFETAPIAVSLIQPPPVRPIPPPPPKPVDKFAPAKPPAASASIKSVKPVAAPIRARPTPAPPQAD